MYHYENTFPDGSKRIHSNFDDILIDLLFLGSSITNTCASSRKDVALTFIYCTNE